MTRKKADASKKRKDKIRKCPRKKNSEAEEASRSAMGILKSELQTTEESMVNMITPSPSQ